jgi:hypothetical protein
MDDTSLEPIYTHRTSESSSAIPDWIALCPDLSDSARRMAHVLILAGRAGRRLNRVQLAAVLRADRRSVTRWTEELVTAGHATLKKSGRYSLIVLHAHGTCESHIRVTTWDSRVRDHDHGLYDPGSLSPMSRKRVRKPLALLDQLAQFDSASRHGTLAHGGGGGIWLEDSDPPSTEQRHTKTGKPSIADLRTETGRWMLRSGFSLTASIELQGLELQACQDDYRRRLDLGQQHGAIVNAWRVEPPAGGQLAGPSPGPWDAAEFQRVRRMLGYEDAAGDISTEEEEPTCDKE